ncbi:hypothetical protein MTDSW087_04338 [Methylobacterium dankookense]|uniref:Uncharacterized protein n=1 Tax=Methylobacterium dankookense TaxID=560405 RepID=A0A564G292_9HYPH|nr:hypothetical protein IFDJLNFL_2932 [Methylobacterium dankookense]VUF14613.1 hypothetical protein MTDSW087_04338 [Methylobacterium dankookense]
MAEFPCDRQTACHILHAVLVLRWSQGKASHYFCVNGGTVSKIVRGLSHNGAVPMPFLSNAAMFWRR